MASEKIELERIKKITRNQEDKRGLMTIPGGILLFVLGAKLLFAHFDPSVMSNPSLFDITGNIGWDLLTAIAHLGFFAIIPIHFWYNRKVGRVIADKKSRTERLVFTLFVVVLVIGTLIVDYNYLLPFSAMGVAISLLWILAIRIHAEFKYYFLVFFAIQLGAVIAGPIIFSELINDELNYMRRLVGLCFFCSGIMVLLMGVKTHSSLMDALGLARARVQNQ